MPLFHQVQSALQNGLSDETVMLTDERSLLLNPGSIAPAAVLVAITDRHEPGVILTTRPQWLRTHAGQVALPGGKIDPGDSDAIAAALREAEEEIALPRSMVKIAGRAGDYVTGTGFHITPIIGVIQPDVPLSANPHEVDAIFEVPLSLLLDHAQYQRRSIEWKGQMRTYHELYWEDFRIWGITAAILLNLSTQLRWNADWQWGGTTA